jgi:glycosyltransferase involved in cell wall biosynthesis
MKKKKILLLSDDLRMSSGVATMSKEMVLGTIHKYDWVQLGGAIKHPEFGKIIDINDDVRKKTGVVDANLKIIPYNGYGDIGILRKLIAEEKPDAILHFTDPHYWQWLYDNEHEIRQSCPLIYWHVWDNIPNPIFNRDYYESCDSILSISKLTYSVVNNVGKMENGTTWKPLEDWQTSYVPHGINPDTFKPLTKISNELGTSPLNGDKYDFILFYNNRNIRRKHPSDVIFSYKKFCDMLPKEKANKCLLLMHTTPVDENGTDLYAVIDALCPEYDIKFTNVKVDQEKLNEIYNLVDCTINIANNEGFGLTTAESLMAGTPIIANVTGGLQDQMGFNFTEDDYIVVGSLHDRFESMHLVKEGDWVIPVWPSSINLNGSVPTPYIFEDSVNVDEVSNAIMTMYKYGKKKRKSVGLKGRKFMLNNLSNKIMCDKMIEGIETTFKNWKPRKKFDLYRIV